MTDIQLDRQSFPTSETFDDIVIDIDNDIKEEGSASLFLGTFNYQRRNWASHHWFRYGVARETVLLEPTDGDGLIDKKFMGAKIILAGVTFGRIINEALYHPFHSSRLNEYFGVDEKKLGEATEEYKIAGGKNTPAGRRIGYGVMAAMGLELLPDTARGHVDDWSGDFTSDPNLRADFVRGVGIELHNGREYHQDRFPTSSI